MLTIKSGQNQETLTAEIDMDVYFFEDTKIDQFLATVYRERANYFMLNSWNTGDKSNIINWLPGDTLLSSLTIDWGQMIFFKRTINGSRYIYYKGAGQKQIH